MKHLITTFSFLCFALSAIGQTGTVNFLLQPANTLIKIDGQVINYAKMETKNMELPAGSYPIQLWASKMAIHYDTITIKANETTKYAKGLNQVSDAYRSYQAAQGKYINKKTLYLITDAAVLLGNVTTAYLLFSTSKELKRTKSQAIQAGLIYETSVAEHEIENQKEEYEYLRSEYEDLRKKHNKRVIIGVPVMTAVAALSGWYAHRRMKNKLKKPVYKEEKPFQKVQPILGMVTTKKQTHFFNLGLKTNF